jgi:Right handed beta helix region
MQERCFRRPALLLLLPLCLGIGGPFAVPAVAVQVRVGLCARVASPTGSDGNAGTKRSPFRTVQRLADSLRPGQVGCLRAGRFTSSGSLLLRIRRGGRPGSRLTIRSYPGERATLVGIVYIPQGSDDVTLASLNIQGNGGQNTIQVNSADDVIQDNDITNNWLGNSCMILGDSSGYGAATRPIVTRNRFHECGNPAHGTHDHGIYANNVNGGQITDNLFWNLAAYAIQFYPSARGVLFARNVVDGGGRSVRGGVLFAGDAGYPPSSNNTVAYNIIAYAQTYNIDYWWGGSIGNGNTAHDNCLWAGKQGNINGPVGFTTSNNLIANPLFTDKTNHIYTLPLTSPCLAVVGYDTAAKLGY